MSTATEVAAGTVAAAAASVPSPRSRYLIGLVGIRRRARLAVRVITGAHDIDSAGHPPGRDRRDLPDRAGRPRRPVVRARRRGQHRPRGQMILGTWGAGVLHLPLRALGRAPRRASLFGVLGGLLHALATVTFGVDHIVSGVAINILALGLTHVPRRGVLRRPRLAVGTAEPSS